MIQLNPSNSINNTLCMARMKKDPTKQCQFRKKNGCDYCGRHKNSSTIFRIDEPYVLKDKGKTLSDKKSPILTLQDIMRVYKIMTCSDICRIKNITKRIATTVLKSYNPLLDLKYLKKQDLINIIINDISKLLPYVSHQTELIKIQKMFRAYYVRYINKLRGPGLFHRQKCINREDFMTFDLIQDIPIELFISINQNNTLYGFDIRSINSLSLHSVDTNYENPYTREKFDSHIIHTIDTLKRICTEKKIPIMYKNEENIAPEIEIKRKAVNIFQKIDELDNYTDVTWFLNLNKKYLKIYYKLLEDIWNYRAELSIEAKKQIVPNIHELFKLSVKQVYDIHDKIKLQHICLDTILLLIDSGINQSNKVTGSIYVLTAFTMVSSRAAQAYPHLVQYE